MLPVKRIIIPTMEKKKKKSNEVHFSDADHQNLKGKEIQKDPGDQRIDLKKLVVNKPWGYEYMMYRNPFVEIWSLFIQGGASTSMHSHPRKKTALIVLDGVATFSTLNDLMALNIFDSVIINKGVFHQTRAVSEEGVHIIEVETPPMKHDLVRLQDAYGREGKKYEGIDMMSLDEGECIRFPEPKLGECVERQFKNHSFFLKKIGDSVHPSDFERLRENDLGIVMEGIIYANEHQILHEVGDIFQIHAITETLSRGNKVKNLSILWIKNGNNIKG